MAAREDKREGREDRREDRRDRALKRARQDIVAATLRVAGRMDLSLVRMEEIAEEAGYAPGSLYTYFSGKEELLAEAIKSLNEELLARLEVPPPEGSWVDALRKLSRQMLDFAGDRRGIFLSLMAGGPHQMAAVCGERVKADLMGYRARFIGAFAQWMKVGLERGALSPARTPRQHTLAFMGIGQSFLAQWLLEESDDPLGAQTDVVVDAFLDGARRRYDGADFAGEEEDR